MAPLGAAFSTSFVGLIWQIVEEQKQKGRIKGMFGTYVSPALVDRMVNSGEEPKLGGVVEHITAYFSDIESFSTMSEKLSPSLLVELMNEYLTACTDILQAEGGTLDKYIGDAVIMIYGAPLALPGHAHKACVGALQGAEADRRAARQVDRARGTSGREIDPQAPGAHRAQHGPGRRREHGKPHPVQLHDDGRRREHRRPHGERREGWGVYTMCTEATRGECEKVEPGRVVFRALGRIVVQGPRAADPDLRAGRAEPRT